MANVDGVPEQHVALVAQWNAERANAVAYGDEGRVAKIDKQLSELGVKKKAAEKRAEAAKDDDEAPKEPPKKAAAPNERHATR